MTDIVATSAQLTASTSSAPPQLCSICNEHPPKYTCPRCTIRTCSLPCSTAHKARTGCSGVRNKAAYVPMNKYSWGTMMDDYVYLEEVGRKVVEMGREIAQGGYHANASSGTRARGMRGRGRGRGGGKGLGRTKRDILKMQLDFRDIDMELLPDGMEKRKLNQSAWDFKNQTALLTIEFKFHPPPDPLALAGQSHPTVTLLTHRNDINTSLLALLQKQVTERPKGKKEKGTPAWVKSLVMPDPDDPEGFVIPTCVMPAPSGIATNLTRQPKTGYYKFDPTQKLSSLLRNKSFVEYPCIEIFEDGSFHGTVIDDSGAIQVGEDERKPKRRKIDVKAIRGLLGGYGSADEEEERNVLITLGDYGGSDAETDMPSRLDEGEVAGGDEGGEGVDEVEGDDIDPEDTTTLDDDAPGEEVNYEELVAKVKAAQSLEDEEDLDWGQSDDDDKLEQVVRTAAQEILRAQGM